MPRATFIAPESSPGQLVSGTNVPDIATVMSNTKYALRADRTPTDMGPGRSIAPVTGNKGRSGRGAGRGMVAQDYYEISGTRYPKVGGTFDIEMEICQPGTAVAWSTTPAWHILRSRYALDTPAITDDTITGVTGIRVTPATPASWETGDVAVCRINGHDYAFQVTGRNGNDLLIAPGLPSTVAGGTTVRLCHRLYVKPGSEGATFSIIDHGPSTLWLGTHCRLGTHSFKVDPKSGRLILAAQIIVGTWVQNHSGADPYTALGAHAAGGPAKLVDIQWRVADDFQGYGGGLTTAPWNVAAKSSLEPEGLEIAVDVASETVTGVHLPTGVCGIKTGDISATWTIPVCSYSGAFDSDPIKSAVRPHAVTAGPMDGPGKGIVFFMGSAQVDADTVPDATEHTLTRDKQVLKFYSTTDGQPVDEAPGTGSATADAALCHWQIGLVQ